MKKGLFLFLILFIGFSKVVYGAEYCFSEEQARRLVVELEQKRILEQEIKEYEGLVENLKKQNELLREQVKLLKEQIDLVKNQSELYKIAYEEEKKKRSLKLIEKGKYFGLGIIFGIILKMGVI